jgi:ferredoxin/flavodoxin
MDSIHAANSEVRTESADAMARTNRRRPEVEGSRRRTWLETDWYTLLYFSPTGNVRHLAKTLASQLDSHRTTVVPLETTEPEQLGGGGHLILLYPIHGFNPPRNVERFVQRLPANLFDAVSVIAVGCTNHWVDGAVSRRLRRTLTRKGYAIVVDEILAMPLTFIMAFSDDLARKLVVGSEKRMEHVAASLGSVPGIAPRVAWWSRLVSFLGRLESPASRLFGLELHANEGCTSCGRCWSHCPQRNIRRGRDGRPRFGFDCLMCMRCIYNCPEKAIAPRISKFIPIKGGYSLSRYVGEECRSS